MSVVEAIENPDDFQTVRVGIAGEWNVRDFAELLSQLQFLSNMAAIADIKAYKLVEPIVRQWTDVGTPARREEKWLPIVGRYLRGGPDLYPPEVGRFRGEIFRVHIDQLLQTVTKMSSSPLVSKIDFASPGVVDIAGVGKIMEQVRLFIKDICDRADRRKDQEIKMENAEQDLLKKKDCERGSTLETRKVGRSRSVRGEAPCRPSHERR
jgi:hypothetical protein